MFGCVIKPCTLSKWYNITVSENVLDSTNEYFCMNHLVLTVATHLLLINSNSTGDFYRKALPSGRLAYPCSPAKLYTVCCGSQTLNFVLISMKLSSGHNLKANRYLSAIKGLSKRNNCPKAQWKRVSDLFFATQPFGSSIHCSVCVKK